MELVSIVVPVYNIEKYIGNCIESIQKQTYENIEILLMAPKTKAALYAIVMPKRTGGSGCSIKRMAG